MLENGMIVGAERHDAQCQDIECSRCTCCKLWVPDDELVAFSNGDRVCNDCLYDYLSNQGADFVPGYIAENEAEFWLDWLFACADKESDGCDNCIVKMAYDAEDERLARYTRSSAGQSEERFGRRIRASGAWRSSRGARDTKTI